MFKSLGLHFPKIPGYGQHPLKAHILFFGALLASFRPSSDINCEWMQTPAEEYGLQEACHILSPLGRTFNLLSWGTAPFQVVQLKDMHLPAFYSLTARRFKRRESIWSKRYYTDCRCGIFSTNFNTSTATGKATKKKCGLNLRFRAKTTINFFGFSKIGGFSVSIQSLGFVSAS